MKQRIETRTYTIEKKNPQHNQEWSWQEGPELRAFIKEQATKRLHEDIKLNKKVTDTEANVESKS